jgi:alcohol dehydrogenase class IV
MGESATRLPVTDAARRAIHAVRELAVAVDMPATVTASGAIPDRLHELVDDSMHSGAIPNNPRTTRKEDVTPLFTTGLA